MKKKVEHRKLLLEKINEYPDNEFVLGVIKFYLKTGFITEKQKRALRKIVDVYRVDVCVYGDEWWKD